MDSSPNSYHPLIELKNPEKINEYLDTLYNKIKTSLPPDIQKEVMLLIVDSFETVCCEEARLRIASGFKGMGYNIHQEKAAGIRGHIRDMARGFNRLFTKIEDGQI